MDVEEGKLEEELVDKPGTTIGTKFSVLHCIRIPFFLREVVFDRSSTRMSIRVHRKDCRRILEDFHCQDYTQFF